MGRFRCIFRNHVFEQRGIRARNPACPEDYKELKETIPWRDGSVRILGITRLKEPQTVESQDGQGNVKVTERPAVYIDVAAVHEYKELAKIK